MLDPHSLLDSAGPAVTLVPVQETEGPVASLPHSRQGRPAGAEPLELSPCCWVPPAWCQPLVPTGTRIDLGHGMSRGTLPWLKCQLLPYLLHPLSAVPKPPVKATGP